MHTSGRVVMRQKWRDLLFLHWAVDPDSLRRLIPPRLDLDLFDGAAYVGLVPFTMRGVRPIGLPPVFASTNTDITTMPTISSPALMICTHVVATMPPKIT